MHRPPSRRHRGTAQACNASSSVSHTDQHPSPAHLARPLPLQATAAPRGSRTLARAASSDASSNRGGSPSTSYSSALATVDLDPVAEPSTALLLAFFASTGRGLFAAQCMVEAIVALYREGRTFAEIKVR